MASDTQKRLMRSLLVKSRMAIGDRFGRLVLAGTPFRVRMNAPKAYRFAVFQCDCGSFMACNLNNITRGIARSCGCLAAEGTCHRNRKRAKRHSSGTRLYRIWQGMRRRCHDPKHQPFRYYGARGIAVCQSWRESFVAFADWATSAGYSENLTLDRRDSSRHYEPENCRWATMEEQENNRSNNVRVTIWGETKTLSQWSRDARCMANRSTIGGRIHRGWEPEAAITTPVFSQEKSY